VKWGIYLNDMLGKTALITGASRGIGRAIAIGLAKCGADIAVNYTKNEEKAKEVQMEVEETGRKCYLVKADIGDKNCADKVAEIVPAVDILVLNASIQYRNRWDKITLQEYDNQMNCNFRSALLLIQKYAPKMAENGWGIIVTVGSVQEAKPHPDMLIYSSSKAALTHMAKFMSLQLADTGVTVNSVAPGVISTDRNADALTNKEYKNMVLNKIPVHFCGEPIDCVGIVKLLCSEEGRYITGQNIFVDGGMSVE